MVGLIGYWLYDGKVYTQYYTIEYFLDHFKDREGWNWYDKPEKYEPVK